MACDTDVMIVHLIGCPLAFASNEHAPKMWVKFGDIPALQDSRVRWTQGSLMKVDPETKVANVKIAKSGEVFEESYDFFLAATGLQRNYPVVPQKLSRDQYLLETADHVDSIKAADTGIVVIGGGAVGIEMAAELKVAEPSTKVTLIQSRDKLLSAEPLPDAFREVALSALTDIDVEVILGRGRVIATETIPAENGKTMQRLTFPDGSHIDAAHVINAVSTQIPTTSYLPPSTLNDEGLVIINNLLRFGDSPRHYAVGDIAAWSGIKRCGAAIHMGYLAAEGMHQQMMHELHAIEPNFTIWPEVVPMIALAIGKKAATYSPDGGVACSEELMRLFFSDDLGFSGCWNHMKLSEPPASEAVGKYSVLPQSAPYREMRGSNAIAA